MPGGLTVAAQPFRPSGKGPGKGAAQEGGLAVDADLSFKQSDTGTVALDVGADESYRPRQVAPEMSADTAFRALDRNNDGVISREEFVQALGRAAAVSSSSQSLADSLVTPGLAAPRQQSMKARATLREMFPRYIPPLGPWEIEGKTSQVVHVELQPGKKIVTQSGAMRYLSPGIAPFAKCGNVLAWFGGESMCRVIYTNESDQNSALIGIAPAFQANIIPVSLDLYPDMVIRGGAFLAANDVNVQITTRCVRSCGALCASGGPLQFQLAGRGTVFLNAGGTMSVRTLRPEEVLICSTGAVVAFQASCTLTVQQVGGGFVNCCCGGQGVLNTKVVGPGLVILQSLSLSEMRSAVLGISRN